MDEMRKSENGFIEAESSVCLAQQAPQMAPQVAEERTSTLDICVFTEQTLRAGPAACARGSHQGAAVTAAALAFEGQWRKRILVFRLVNRC